jgi:hypothetical protein
MSSSPWRTRVADVERAASEQPRTSGTRRRAASADTPKADARSHNLYRRRFAYAPLRRFWYSRARMNQQEGARSHQESGGQPAGGNEPHSDVDDEALSPPLFESGIGVLTPFTLDVGEKARVCGPFLDRTKDLNRRDLLRAMLAKAVASGDGPELLVADPWAARLGLAMEMVAPTLVDVTRLGAPHAKRIERAMLLPSVCVRAAAGASRRSLGRRRRDRRPQTKGIRRRDTTRVDARAGVVFRSCSPASRPDGRACSWA